MHETYAGSGSDGEPRARRRGRVAGGSVRRPARRDRGGRISRTGSGWSIRPRRRSSTCARARSWARTSIDTLIVQPAARAVDPRVLPKVTARKLDRVTIPVRLLRSDGSASAPRSSISAHPRSAGGESSALIGVVRDVTDAARGGSRRRDAARDRRRRRGGDRRRRPRRATSSSSARPPSACTAGAPTRSSAGPSALLIADHEQHLLPEVRRRAAGRRDRPARGRRAAPRRHPRRGRAQRQPDPGPGRPHAGHGADRARHLRAPARPADARALRRARAERDRRQGPRRAAT